MTVVDFLIVIFVNMDVQKAIRYVRYVPLPIIAILTSVLIYLLVERSKQVPPRASNVLVKPECPVCPKCPECTKCLNYELVSSRGTSTHIVSPGVMYHLSVRQNSIKLEGYDVIWSIDAPGASHMRLNGKGQLQVENATGDVVYETPAQVENVEYVAYVSNEGKLEIRDRNERKVVFSK